MIIMSLCIVSFAWQSTFRRSLQYNYTPSALTFQIISKIFHVFHYFFAFDPACRGDFIINIRKTSEISKRLRDFFQKMFNFFVPRSGSAGDDALNVPASGTLQSNRPRALTPYAHQTQENWNVELAKQNWFISY